MLSKLDRALLSKYLAAAVAARRVARRRCCSPASAHSSPTHRSRRRSSIARRPVSRSTGSSGIALVFLGVALRDADRDRRRDVRRRATSAGGRRTSCGPISPATCCRSTARSTPSTAPGELIERIDGDVSAIAELLLPVRRPRPRQRRVPRRRARAAVPSRTVRIGAVLAVFVARSVRVHDARRRVRRTPRAGARRRAAAELIRLPRGAPRRPAGPQGERRRRVRHAPAPRAARASGTGASPLRRWRSSLFNGTIGLFFVIGTGAALALSAALHGTGAITLGGVYLVFRYTTMMRLPLDRLQRQMNSFQQATGGIVRVRELLATQPRVVDGAGATFAERCALGRARRCLVRVRG